jgi:hypothetical protein
MTEATIRISTEAPPQAIEVDLRDATEESVAGAFDRIALAYRTAFGEDIASAYIEFVGEEIPFPEAGDPHPFERPEEGPTPESSQVGTTRLRTIEDAEELDALPVGSIVLDDDYDGYTRVEDGWTRGRPGLATHTTERIMAYAPIVLVVEGP